MHKINLLSYLILLPFFCFSQNNKPADNGDWQTALVELNIYIKEHFNKSFEVKGDVIYNYFNNGNANAKIKDLFYVIKLPKYKYVYLTCKNEDKCVYSSYTNYYHPEFTFSCKTEAEMDKTFELLNDFWLKLTGLESKTKYTNDQLKELQIIEEKYILLTDIANNDPAKESLGKYLNMKVYAEHLSLNNDNETYSGRLIIDSKNSYSVNKVKIKIIPKPELDTNTVEYKTAKSSKELGNALKDYTTTVTNNQNQNAFRDEAVLEMKKLAEKVKEYNQSMKMYQKDCEKDKEYHKYVRYGRSTPCDNIISYNKMIKSAIERYLEKYQNYITEGDVKHLKQQISNAETNITNAKLN